MAVSQQRHVRPSLPLGVALWVVNAAVALIAVLALADAVRDDPSSSIYRGNPTVAIDNTGAGAVARG